MNPESNELIFWATIAFINMDSFEVAFFIVMVRILDDFRRFLKVILMNNTWSVLQYTIAHLCSIYMSWL